MGLSVRRVQQLQADGTIKRDKEENGYRLEECVQAYIDFKVTSETGRSSAISKEKVQAEHEEIKKQISILKLRRLRRELHEASDVEYYLNDMLTRFKNRILSLPPKIVMVTSGEDTNQAIQDVQELLEGALSELSEYNPDEIEHGTDMEEFEPDEDEEEDDGE